LRAKSREPAQQHCPWLKKIALAAPAIAASMSASGRMIAGDLPPSFQRHFLQISGRGLDARHKRLRRRAVRPDQKNSCLPTIRREEVGRHCSRSLGLWRGRRATTLASEMKATQERPDELGQ
jgi:hypothetical protein